MAWNPEPEVAALRDFGNKFDRPVVVTFALHRDGDAYQLTSYGKTRALCKLAASFAEQIGECIQNGTIEPPLVERDAKPGEPSVMVWERVCPAPPPSADGGE